MNKEGRQRDNPDAGVSEMANLGSVYPPPGLSQAG